VERPYLAGIFARYPGVERILRGHIHRFLQRRFGGTVPAAAPGTTAIALHLQDNAEPASSLAPGNVVFPLAVAWPSHAPCADWTVSGAARRLLTRESAGRRGWGKHRLVGLQSQINGSNAASAGRLRGQLCAQLCHSTGSRVSLRAVVRSNMLS